MIITRTMARTLTTPYNFSKILFTYESKKGMEEEVKEGRKEGEEGGGEHVRDAREFEIRDGSKIQVGDDSLSC